ncbi:MAG: cation diffusion facilitator family transporter [Vampirovibrio sp.]|nr:cation diffusion facilitator family transporter [Vampirovibrio sp.]
MASSEPPGSSSVTQSSTSTLLGGGVSADYRHAMQTVIWALVANFVIATMKLMIAMFVARSAALFSEGLHSLGDGLNSIILLFGIRRGNRAPDRTHPFGYGLETNLWAMLASVLLLLFSLWAVWEGVDHWFHPHPVENQGWAIFVLAVSLMFESFVVYNASQTVLAEVGVKCPWYAAVPTAWKHYNKVVGPTTRFVFLEDNLAFGGALYVLCTIVGTKIALQVGALSPQTAHMPDAIASVVIGLMLLVLAVELFRFNHGFLIGASASEPMEKKIKELTLSVHGVSKVDDLKTIDRGISGLAVYLTVEVEPDTPIKDADDLIEHIKHKLMGRIPSISDVFIELLADEAQVNWSTRYLQLVERGRTIGILKPRDEALLKKAYDFTESIARDVMVPRTDVEYVEANTPIHEVADLMVEEGYSRIPVYKEHVDDIVGLVHSRDVFHLVRQNKLEEPVAQVVREIEIYPENKPLSDMLEEFKRNKIQMAAVADEHGGFAGVVTVEDLMEEIVGEIWDEHDEEAPMLEFVADNKILVNGKYEIEDLNERLDLNFPTSDFKTVGGYVFGSLGREPETGDQVTFEDFTLTVHSNEGPRISTVMIEGPVPFQADSSLEEDKEGPAEESAEAS